jgi:hypothetical protein
MEQLIRSKEKDMIIKEINKVSSSKQEDNRILPNNRPKDKSINFSCKFLNNKKCLIIYLRILPFRQNYQPN